MIKKAFWYLMLVISVAMFVITIVSSDILLLFISLGLAFIVRVKGNKILFGVYDRKQKERIARIHKLRAERTES